MAEPVVSLTDVLLGLAALGFALCTRRTRLWCAGFAAAAAAALTGVVFHADGGQSAALHGALWNAILALIVLSAVLFAAAALSHPLPAESPRTGWIQFGALLSAAALAVQQSPLRWGALDHNSLFHLIEIAALYLFFRAAHTETGQEWIPLS